MRPLTDEEIRVFFEKLSEYIGRNIKALIDRDDEPYCFRLHKERVYYVRCAPFPARAARAQGPASREGAPAPCPPSLSRATRSARRRARPTRGAHPSRSLAPSRSERVLRQATCVGREELVGMGVTMGKFTKSKNFRLKITALDVIAAHAQVGGRGLPLARAPARARGSPAMDMKTIRASDAGPPRSRSRGDNERSGASRDLPDGV